MNKKIIYITGISFLLLLVGSNTRLPASTTISETNEMNTQDSIITAKALYDAFKKDKVAAEKQYVNKTITIKGFVVYAGPDVYTLPSVELSEKKGGKSRTLCVLPFSDYLKLRKVSKGDEATITGQVRGFYEKGDQVLLKQCVIKE